MTLRLLFAGGILAGAMMSANAVEVGITMNSTSQTMKLIDKTTQVEIQPTSTASGYKYTFDATEGDYQIIGYNKSGKENGKIEISVWEGETNQFTILTGYIEAENRNSSNKYWTISAKDYTIEMTMKNGDGDEVASELYNTKGEARSTFLTMAGYIMDVTLIPSEAHKKEGFVDTPFPTRNVTTAYGSYTFWKNITQILPYEVTVPADAEFLLGYKAINTEFQNMEKIEPAAEETNDGIKVVKYQLEVNKTYQYRTWKTGGLTQAGYFTMGATASSCPKLDFTEENYAAYDPHQVNHDVMSNSGYEVGDIFVNINPQGHLMMNVGETFDAHAMRSTQLLPKAPYSTSNYSAEPDFHYTVITPDGQLSNGVIEIEEEIGNPWAKIKAVGNGTAIVLVTYDAVEVNYYDGAKKTAFAGGNYWGAIWPENTAAYVVTVGQTPSTVISNMKAGGDYNTAGRKLAGTGVDAEHDVFYYLDTEEGYPYVFTPENASKVEMAYPEIGQNSATYKGFGSEGVTANEDNSFTVMLKEGRQIVKLTDADGNSTYQVLTARKVHREMINKARPESKIFQPGDVVTVQYSGLSHPANRLGSVYRYTMSGTVYKKQPSGLTAKTSYTNSTEISSFASLTKTQAVTIEIPSTLSLTEEKEYSFSDGMLEVKSSGMPAGAHRFMTPENGPSSDYKSASTSVFLGSLPDFTITVSPYKTFDIKPNSDVDGIDVKLIYNKTTTLSPEADGSFKGTYGHYRLVAEKEGYRRFFTDFDITDDSEGEQVVDINMEIAEAGCWDGKTLTAPAIDEASGEYMIATGAELAWLAKNVTSSTTEYKARLISDIDLGNFDWTPIGKASKAKFNGSFNGDGHKIVGMYAYDASNTTAADYQGLFYELKNSLVSGVTVYGNLTGRQYVSGIACDTDWNATIDRCASYVNINGESFVGGICGIISFYDTKITNSYNGGDVSGTSMCGGILGAFYSSNVTITNVFNTGKITGKKVGALFGYSGNYKLNIENAFALEEFSYNVGYETYVSDERVASGEIAWMLGEAFGQELGEDDSPLLGASKVYRVQYVMVDSDLEPAADNSAADEEELPCIYTNGQLPSEIDGESIAWYEDKEKSKAVDAVDADMILYVERDNFSGIEDTLVDEFDARVDVYTMTGVCLMRGVDPREALRRLTPGLYIVGGKKVLVK